MLLNLPEHGPILRKSGQFFWTSGAHLRQYHEPGEILRASHASCLSKERAPEKNKLGCRPQHMKSKRGSGALPAGDALPDEPNDQKAYARS